MPKYILPLLIFSLVACCIELDISVPGFRAMSDDFKVANGIIQLTVAYNFLGFCLASLVYGPLSDCYGRRKIMIIGNFIMLAGAISCVMAPSINWLLFARFIQGVGASTSAVVVFAIIADLYQNDDNGIKCIGIMNSILTVLIAIAPTLGGIINQIVGWRGNYTIVACICFISWLLLVWLLPETKIHFQKFDLQRILTDYKRLFTHPNFICTSLIPSLLYSGYVSFVAAAPFLYMETFQLPLYQYIFHQSVVIAAFSLVSLYTNKITQKFGTKKTIILAMVLNLFAAFIFVIISLLDPYSPYLVTACMVVFCFSFAICYPILFRLSLSIFPETNGTASSMIMSLRALLISIFVGATSYGYNGEPMYVSFIILCASLGWGLWPAIGVRHR